VSVAGQTDAAAGKTVQDALDAAAGRLAAAGVEAPRREAQLLMAHARACTLARVLADAEDPLDADGAAAFDAAVRQRAARKPLSRIVGSREFWSLEFRLGPAVLDPRPDSETLVRAVLDRVADRGAPLRLLDLGTGSGCLLLALLQELPNAGGLGLDRDPAAAEAARANAAALGLAGRAEIRCADWADGLDGRFDVVVCNPPYVATHEIDTLAPEVARYDPRGALDGGLDGLDAYRALAPRLDGWLAADGLAALEVGQGQAEAVAALLRAAGLRSPASVCDLAGVPRCVLASPAG